jgi:hypothetical protein
MCCQVLKQKAIEEGSMTLWWIPKSKEEVILGPIIEMADEIAERLF